jgi:hypothetical protein
MGSVFMSTNFLALGNLLKSSAAARDDGFLSSYGHKITSAPRHKRRPLGPPAVNLIFPRCENYSLAALERSIKMRASYLLIGASLSKL